MIRPNTTRCPECGADLRGGQALGYTNNLVQLRHAPAFALVAVVICTGTYLYIRNRIESTDWLLYRPAAWLLHDVAQEDDLYLNRRIGEELARRMSDSGFAARHEAQVRAVIDEILSKHPSEPTRKAPGRLALISSAWKHGLLTREQLATHIDQSMYFHVATAEQSVSTAAGLHLAAQLALVDVEALPDSLQVFDPAFQVSIDGRHVDVNTNDPEGWSYGTDQVIQCPLVVDCAPLVLEPGDHSLQIEATYAIKNHPTQSPLSLHRRAILVATFTLDSRAQLQGAFCPGFRDIAFRVVEEDAEPRSRQ